MIPVGYCNSGRILNMQSSVITYLNIYTIRLLGCLHHKHKTSCTCSKNIDFSPREPIVLYLCFIIFAYIIMAATAVSAALIPAPIHLVQKIKLFIFRVRKCIHYFEIFNTHVNVMSQAHLLWELNPKVCLW